MFNTSEDSYHETIKYIVLNIISTTLIVSGISIIIIKLSIIISTASIIVGIISILIHGSAPLKKQEFLGMPTMY